MEGAAAESSAFHLIHDQIRRWETQNAPLVVLRKIP